MHSNHDLFDFFITSRACGMRGRTNQNREFILNVKKVQTDKFYNSNFSCGNLLAISCLNGSFYLVQKLKLDILQRIDYSQMIKSENSVSFKDFF